MTGNEIIDRCVDLLGYRDAIGDEDLEIATKRSAVEYINQVVLEICIAAGNKEYSQINNLETKIIQLSNFEVSVLLYGVCMWIAFGIGDTEKQSVFSRLYNSKRAALSHTDKIRDVTPNPEG